MKLKKKEVFNLLYDLREVQMAETSKPEVSIIVPTYRRLGVLKNCLQAIEQMEGEIGEILIICRSVDDKDTHRWLVATAVEKEKWKIIDVDQPGVVHAINSGLDVATKDFIAIFDDDAVPRRNWLNLVLDQYKDDDVGAVGGRDVVDVNGVKLDRPEVKVAGVIDFWGNLIGNHHLVVGKARDVDALKGCNWSFRRSAIGTGRLDSRLLGMGAQFDNELLFCLNIRKAGWRIRLDPNAIVDHYPAVRHEIKRGEWTKERCFQQSCNHTMSQFSVASTSMKLRHTFYMLAIGSRYCPGLYYMLHALLKRPKELAGIMLGGWSGFFKGIGIAEDIKRNPSGYIREI
ncbi:glycosyltransferase [Leucothrix arctica]|uniref:Glycosyltransferase 2-like domain-containing protein n=1 Tax=Leucothrix arctica TaxID=1481894 RepID=A0A317CMN4_9GAMM|nr:glycosyltransferase family 2 protein [Leucothrix arctica]PWQ98713.1 hypothetical protein DKT75_02565 [Leucothrix arctica]